MDNLEHQRIIPVGWGGVGWGGVITFMFLCTHRHSNLIIFLAVLQTQALLFQDQIPVGWGGVGYSKRSTFRRSKRTPDRCDPYGLLHRHDSLSCRSWHAPSDYVEKNKSAGQEEVNADGPPFDALGWCT